MNMPKTTSCKISNGIDYLDAVRDYESSGHFSGDLGDLMPIGMSNVLRIPLAIMTSSFNNPVIPICPRHVPLQTHSMFLAYTTDGPGHYDATAYIQEIEQENLEGKHVFKVFFHIPGGGGYFLGSGIEIMPVYLIQAGF